MKVTLPHLRELKIAGTPIVMVTAYDLPSARIVDSAGVDDPGRGEVVGGHHHDRRAGDLELAQIRQRDLH